jgi:restriction system protein
MRRDDSLLDEIFDTLKHTPIWVGPTLAAAAFLLLRFAVPAMMPASKPGTFDIGTILRPMLPMLAWLTGFAVIVAWIGAELHKLLNRRLLDSRSSVSSLGDISWQEFEHLVSEAYRRQGYVAQVVGNSSGDGGIDIQLTRPGETVLVQCKQWKAWKVGVTIVREMLGVVVSRKADKGIIVTSGRFTGEAHRFAEKADPPVQLIDGSALFELIRSVQRRGPQEGTQPPPTEPSSLKRPTCPACGTQMVLRTARRGSNAGSQFWGCSGYPKCRGKRPLAQRRSSWQGQWD